MPIRSSTGPGRRTRRGLALLLAVAALAVVVLNWTSGRLPAEPRRSGRVVSVDGMRIRYVERPGAGTPVVLLHGLPGTAEDFDAVTRRLAGRRTIAIDRPGYGSSTRGYVPFDRQLSAVHHLLERLAVPRAIVVAPSSGGTIALGLAARHPSQVAALVLAAAAAAGLRIGGPERAQARLVKLLGLPVVRQLAGVTFSQLLRTVAANSGDRDAFSPAPVSAAHLHRLLAINMSHDDLAAVAGEKLAADAAIARVDHGLDTIRTPATVIQADRDRSVAPVHGRRLAASLARARLVMVHGGHMTPYTHPGVIAGAITGHGDLLSAAERGRAPVPPRRARDRRRPPAPARADRPHLRSPWSEAGGRAGAGSTS